MEVSQFLKHYQSNGLSFFPIPFKSKIPDREWKIYQKHHPTEEKVRQWSDGHKTNIAIVCGAVSGNLVVIDCDSLEKYEELKPVIERHLSIDKIEDCTPVVKTGKGYHIYFKTPTPIKSIKFPRLDIKGEGGYVIAPPSVHPNGQSYTFMNAKYLDIFVIASLKDIGINIEKPEEQIGKAENWITEALQKGVKAGARNDTCFKLAGYFKNIHPQDITREILLTWNQKNQPPLSSKDVLTAIDSAYNYYAVKDPYINMPPFLRNSNLKQDNFGTTSGQDWGIYAKKFDELLSGAGGRQDKREIAETIGLKVTSDSFRKLLARRKAEGKVRAYRGSHFLIEWINRDYSVVRLDESKVNRMLDICLPLNLHKYVSVPPRSMIGLAGVPSSGKTSFLLEMAELNVQNECKTGQERDKNGTTLPVYYWFNEMSEDKMIYRCEDFPLLSRAQQEGRFFPVMQTNFDFADVLQPDAINIIDYIDRDEDVFLIGGDIKKLYNNLNKGIVAFALQKKAHFDLGYGGVPTIKLCNLYLILDIQYQSGKSQHCLAEIKKCKDWKSVEINPVGLQCKYYTNGKHGKLVQDGEWTLKGR